MDTSFVSPEPDPKRGLFHDAAAAAVYAGFCALDPALQFEFARHVQQRLATLDLELLPTEARAARAIRALREAADLLERRGGAVSSAARRSTGFVLSIPSAHGRRRARSSSGWVSATGTPRCGAHGSTLSTTATVSPWTATAHTPEMRRCRRSARHTPRSGPSPSAGTCRGRAGPTCGSGRDAGREVTAHPRPIGSWTTYVRRFGSSMTAIRKASEG